MVGVVGFGPAVAVAAFVVLRYGRTSLGWGGAAAIAAVLALGALGLSALLLAWLPWLLERAGLQRAGAFLRRYWDEDAR